MVDPIRFAPFRGGRTTLYVALYLPLESALRVVGNIRPGEGV
jgi:hypothetical protein